MKGVEAVIFDADGTLFDTFELLVAAYRHVSESHELSVPEPAEVRALLGHPIRHMFQTFYPGQDIEQLLKTNNEFIAANAMKSEAFAGVKDLLDELTAKSVKLGVLTSGTAMVLDVINHHGFKDYFASVVHTDRITNPKPHPEGFLLACRECEVEPQNAVMVGDTEFDIKTGKNAKALATIAITHGFGDPSELEDAQPDYIADSIFEVNQILTGMVASHATNS